MLHGRVVRYIYNSKSISTVKQAEFDISMSRGVRAAVSTLMNDCFWGLPTLSKKTIDLEMRTFQMRVNVKRHQTVSADWYKTVYGVACI